MSCPKCGRPYSEHDYKSVAGSVVCPPPKDQLMRAPLRDAGEGRLDPAMLPGCYTPEDNPPPEPARPVVPTPEDIRTANVVIVGAQPRNHLGIELDMSMESMYGLAVRDTEPGDGRAHRLPDGWMTLGAAAPPATGDGAPVVWVATAVRMVGGQRASGNGSSPAEAIAARNRAAWMREDAIRSAANPDDITRIVYQPEAAPAPEPERPESAALTVSREQVSCLMALAGAAQRLLRVLLPESKLPGAPRPLSSEYADVTRWALTSESGQAAALVAAHLMSVRASMSHPQPEPEGAGATPAADPRIPDVPYPKPCDACGFALNRTPWVLHDAKLYAQSKLPAPLTGPVPRVGVDRALHLARELITRAQEWDAHPEEGTDPLPEFVREAIRNIDTALREIGR